MNARGWKPSAHALILAAALAALILLAVSGGAGDRSGASAQEKRIAEVLSAVAGAGKVEVALFYGQEGAQTQPTGAVVVAQGAEDVAVRLTLIRAVRTLLGLPEAAVDVFAMAESPR